ncbi:peptidase [Nocardia speluncae]|uniref:Peptidase n=1 Tax=Nocardia speluncae TaxID=419477 RepID=A0A846XAW3_9NOCA|nr:peptidase [Nocardia speluncae]NKY32229.1 peptidase [Nocardia speluncae]
MTLYRTLTLFAAALLAVVGCGDDPHTGATRPPAIPAPPPQFWSAPADTPQQQAAVAQATRQIDVCALLPRDTLDDLDLGEIRDVTIGLDSCRAVLGDPAPAEAATLTWHSTLLPPLAPRIGANKQLGDVNILLVPDREPGARSCGATARFPSGAAFYLGLSIPNRDSCAVADSLLPGMIDRWRQSPAQGTSPDTVTTVLLGADPCAVRAKLDGTADTDQLRLTQCLFHFRDETATVAYDYRVTDQVRARATEEKIDNRTVFRTTSLYDSRIPIYSAVVGPELPAASTAFVPRVPAVEVTSATDDVARQVMSQVLTLFPQ